VNRIYLSLRSETAQRIVKSQRILRPDHAARHASRHPTPPREKRACRGPGLAANSKNSAGEPSTGACIGMPFCSCLVIRGYASAAAGYVGPAELPLCAALFVEEVSPVIHHRLIFLSVAVLQTASEQSFSLEMILRL
jgi:hypothetical protein